MIINELLSKAVKISESRKSGLFSFRMINSMTGGRRIEVSKSLVNALKLEDKIYITMTMDPVTIIFSKDSICEFSYSFPLKNARTIYCSSIITSITESAKIDYSNCSSRSFSTSEQDTINDNTVIVFVF